MEIVMQGKFQNASCRHYWVIESPDGKTSVGYCKLCHQSREFYNSIPLKYSAAGHIPASISQSSVAKNRAILKR